ncbi:hypothetical protein ABFV83_09605 [Lacrimispora sp. BS-2]|uniref:Uncharacterized protein n=1 Tax=Lacrimispora sp. BS-2 TaxID=3151850 RepID=A0AAU7PUF7_9FIRM
MYPIRKSVVSNSDRIHFAGLNLTDRVVIAAMDNPMDCADIRTGISGRYRAKGDSICRCTPQ